VLAAARAHVDTQVLEAFCRGVEECKSDNAHAALSKVCDLYAVSTIEQHRDWYQEHGRISSTRSKAAIRMVNRLCGELRPHAFELAQALRVPDAVLPEFGPNGIVS
jgi:acyl-CoA oxidase